MLHRKSATMHQYALASLGKELLTHVLRPMNCFNDVPGTPVASLFSSSNSYRPFTFLREMLYQSGSYRY